MLVEMQTMTWIQVGIGQKVIQVAFWQRNNLHFVYFLDHWGASPSHGFPEGHSFKGGGLVDLEKKKHSRQH